MRSYTLAGVGIAFLAFGLAGTAAAESLLSISYTITDGTFSGINLNGPITGGSLIYTPPGGSVETPFYCTTSTATSCGSAQLTLKSTAGTFSAVISSLVSININPSYVQLFGTYGSGSSGPDPVTPYLFLFGYYATGTQSASIFGSVYAPSSTSPFSHYFVLGQEVRTVPEPSPRMAQLGAGIGLLGILGARTGMAIRARRKGRR